MPSLIVARLRDRYNPSRMGIRPSVVSSSSFGCHSVESSWMTGGLRGESSTISVTGWPARTAAEYTNGLKVEPGSRTAWVARLYLESSQCRPPTIARMYPVLASSASGERLDEGGGDVAVVGAVPGEQEGIRLPQLGRLRRQETLVLHQAQHHVSPAHGALRVGPRVVKSGQFGERRERSRFRDVELLCV